VDAGASDAQGFLRLAVDDSGPGLRGRSVEQLVTPFYSTKPEGMGMGLAICRSIIEAHHGSFDAVAGALGGACFSLTLPLVGAWPDGRDTLSPESRFGVDASSESEVRP